MAQRETGYHGSPHGGGPAHTPRSHGAAGHLAGRTADPGIGGQRGHAAGGQAGTQRGQMHMGAQSPAGGAMAGRHPGTNSALRRHMAQNQHGLASQRHAQALSGAQTPARTRAGGAAAGLAGHPGAGALGRYVANKPTSRVGGAPVRSFPPHGGAQHGPAGYQPRGQHRAGPSGGPLGGRAGMAAAPHPRLQNLIRNNPNGLAAQRYAGAQAGWPGQYHHPHRGPWPYPPDAVGYNIPRTDTGAGMPDTDGSDGAAAPIQDSDANGASTSVTWEEPTDMSTAIGHPGAGVFILERTGDGGNWLPVLVGTAPEGFGRRLEYVMDDLGPSDDVQARLGTMQVRPNHPADRAVLRAIAHDIVARIRNAGADQMLTNQSGVSDREQRLLDQQPPEHGGEAPDYLGT